MTSKPDLNTVKNTHLIVKRSLSHGVQLRHEFLLAPSPQHVADGRWDVQLCLECLHRFDERDHLDIFARVKGR